MDNDEVKMKVVLSKEQQKQALMHEFESLRPKWHKPIPIMLILIGVMYLLKHFSTEILETPVLMAVILLFAILLVALDNFNESKRINRRIDLLHRMLKKDV